MFTYVLFHLGEMLGDYKKLGPADPSFIVIHKMHSQTSTSYHSLLPLIGDTPTHPCMVL